MPDERWWWPGRPASCSSDRHIRNLFRAAPRHSASPAPKLRLRRTVPAAGVQFRPGKAPDQTLRGHEDPPLHPFLRPFPASEQAAEGARRGLVPEPPKTPVVTSKPDPIRALTELQPRG